MTFSEQNVNREQDGKFGAKTGAEPDYDALALADYETMQRDEDANPMFDDVLAVTQATHGAAIGTNGADPQRHYDRLEMLRAVADEPDAGLKEMIERNVGHQPNEWIAGQLRSASTLGSSMFAGHEERARKLEALAGLLEAQVAARRGGRLRFAAGDHVREFAAEDASRLVNAIDKGGDHGWSKRDGDHRIVNVSEEHSGGVMVSYSNGEYDILNSREKSTWGLRAAAHRDHAAAYADFERKQA